MDRVRIVTSEAARVMSVPKVGETAARLWWHPPLSLKFKRPSRLVLGTVFLLLNSAANGQRYDVHLLFEPIHRPGRLHTIQKVTTVALVLDHMEVPQVMST